MSSADKQYFMKLTDDFFKKHIPTNLIKTLFFNRKSEVLYKNSAIPIYVRQVVTAAPEILQADFYFMTSFKKI